MKKLALPIVLISLSLAVFAILRLTRSASAPVPEAAGVESRKLEPDAGSTTPLTPAVPESAAASPEDRQGLPAAATAEGGLETWEIARSIWVEGVVRSPGGCVDEGPVEVFASSEPMDADALSRLLERDRPPKTLLSRRKVGEGGAFKIPFPPEAKSGHLSVRGRFLYLPDSIAVDLAGGSRNVTLEPKCGAWVTGSVNLPQDSPATLADLEGTGFDLKSSMQNASGAIGSLRGFRRSAKLAKGAFEFRAVPADVPCTIEVGPTKLAAASQELEKMRAGREVPVRIDLLRGGTVRGAVRDGDGNPVADAQVVAAKPGQWFGFDNREVRSGKSGADGAFELPAVMPGAIVVRASHDGYLESDRAKLDLQDNGSADGVQLALTRGNSVSGSVAWPDGKPAVSVEVAASFDKSQLMGMGAFNAMRGASGRAQSDEQGAFTIRGLGKGPFTLEAKARPPDSKEEPAAPAEAGAPKGAEAGAPKSDGEDGSLSPDDSKKEHWWRSRADGVQPGATAVALVLRAPEGVPGKVVDEKGLPVAKFKIQAVRQSKGPMGSVGEEEKIQSFEDPEGKFLVTGMIQGTWNLYAIADGFGLPEPVAVEIPRKTGDPELSIALEHSAGIAGVVKSPAGTVVAAAIVSVDSGEPSWKAMLQSGPKPPKATSSADGAFQLDGLHSGKFHVAATSKEYAKSAPVEVELTTGQHLTGLELTLRQGGTLTGEVYAEGGRPATGMFVQAVQMKDFDSQIAFTGTKGEFKIEHLAAGSWQVIAMPSRGDSGGGSGASSGGSGGDDGKDFTDNASSMLSKMKMTVTTITDGEETHVVLGAPPQDPVEVHGVVLHSGEPCAGSMVAFVPEGKEALKGMKTCTVGKDGAYSVKVDAPGHYAISVQMGIGGMGQQSTVEFSRDIPEGKDYHLDLEMPTARISGHVSGPDGEPASGARVSLHPETPVESGTMWGGQYHEGVTDADGKYDVQMLRPGTYTLSVGGMTLGGMFGGDTSFGREMRGGIKLTEGEWMRDLDFRLKKPGVLEVTVVDAGGAPVAEASVFARDASGKLVDGMSMISTDSGGKARYRGLGPGTYTILARKDLLASADSARAKIDEGGSAEARVALQPGTVLVVTCLGEESKPIRGTISVIDDQGREVGAMISLSEAMKMFNENGFSTLERRIGPLPQGKYTVRATGPDGKVVTKPVSLTGQAERKITIHLD